MAYGPLAADVQADLKGFYLDPQKRALRQQRILDNWDNMKNWVKANLPMPEQLKEILLRVGAPVELREIDVTEELLKLAMENAKEVRVRYTVFRLAEDIAGSTGAFFKIMQDQKSA
ncbi:MAG: hypothetical protein ACM3X9_00745 [Bacillota bacterium]